jgi:hypothetical protein
MLQVTCTAGLLVAVAEVVVPIVVMGVLVAIIVSGVDVAELDCVEVAVVVGDVASDCV